MPKPVKESWFTRGTFLQRLAKESLIIAPFSFLMCFYGAFIRSSRLNLSVSAVVAIALLLTGVISSYNATRPVAASRVKEPGNTQLTD